MRGSRALSRRVLRAGAAVAVTGALVVGLSGCLMGLQTAVDLATEQTVDCTGWTVDVTEDAAGATIGAAGDGQLFRGTVFDGDGTVVYLSPEYDTLTYSTGSQTALYTTPPTTNPIIAGMYMYAAGTPAYSPDDKYRAEHIGGCASLPLAASAALAREQTSPTAGLPTFDVRFGAPVTGFTADDLVLGGTAGATGVTITKLTDQVEKSKYATLEDYLSPAWSLLQASEIYRVSVNGVTQDGTVTLSLPAGSVDGPFGDVNEGTATATAVVDTTGPAMDTIADAHTLAPAGATGAVVTWELPSASDASGVADVTCLPTSGSTFPLGDTTVTCTATDLLGNASTSSFAVGVRTTPTVSIAPQSTDAPRQGGSATFALSATDDLGAAVPLAADDYTVTSSVASDVITRGDGAFTVSFPHASPHTLTVVHTATGARSVLTVEVTPSAAASASAPRASGLATTGADSTPLIVVGGVLLLLGALVLVIRLIRRRRD